MNSNPTIRVLDDQTNEEFRIEPLEIQNIIKEKLKRDEFTISKEPRQKYRRITLIPPKK